MAKINNVAAARLSSAKINGPALLEMFQQLADQAEAVGAEGNYAQFSFVHHPDEIEEGDLIPELHLSLRPHLGPIMVQPGDIDESTQT